MAKILIVYYSMYGHVETMANAVAAGAAEVAAEVVVTRVPDLVPENTLRKAGAKLNQAAPLADPNELDQYDGILFGTPTRFGNMCAQLRNFLDQTGAIWVRGGLAGRVGGVFCSTGSGNGSEATILSVYNTLIHHGMVIAGVPITNPDVTKLTELRSGSLYGACTLAGSDGRRQPSAAELAIARAQGRYVAELATRLRG